MRDDAVRMLSGPNQREWLARNTRYEPKTDRLLVWNIITWPVVSGHYGKYSGTLSAVRPRFR